MGEATLTAGSGRTDTMSAGVREATSTDPSTMHKEEGEAEECKPRGEPGPVPARERGFRRWLGGSVALPDHSRPGKAATATWLQSQWSLVGLVAVAIITLLLTRRDRTQERLRGVACGYGLALRGVGLVRYAV